MTERREDPSEQELAYGRRIAEMRRAKGLTQPDFAELIGKSVNTVRLMEAGKRNGYMRQIAELADHLETTPNAILGFSEASGPAGVPVTPEVLGAVLEPVVRRLGGDPEFARLLAGSLLTAISAARDESEDGQPSPLALRAAAAAATRLL